MDLHETFGVQRAAASDKCDKAKMRVKNCNALVYKIQYVSMSRLSSPDGEVADLHGSSVSGPNA
jgi:hypothetical protein